MHHSNFADCIFEVVWVFLMLNNLNSQAFVLCCRVFTFNSTPYLFVHAGCSLFILSAQFRPTFRDIACSITVVTNKSPLQWYAELIRTDTKRVIHGVEYDAYWCYPIFCILSKVMCQNWTVVVLLELIQGGKEGIISTKRVFLETEGAWERLPCNDLNTIGIILVSVVRCSCEWNWRFNIRS